MNGRRRKDEPFNPFAPNASQKARDRKERSQKVQPKPRVPEPKKEVNDLAAKQRAAMAVSYTHLTLPTTPYV